VFWAFRIMVGIGLIMLVLGWSGAVQEWRGRLLDSRRLLRALSLATPIGFVAVLAGWWVTEVGRQPWIVHGLMRTGDSVSEITGGEVTMSFSVFVVLYSALFIAYLYYFTRVVRSADKTRIEQGEPG